MLSDFLRSAYKARIIQRSNIQFKNWIVDEKIVKRNFICDSFQSAAYFMGTVSDYLTNRNANFSVKNVYNQVEVVFDGEITDNDIDSIKNIDQLYSIKNNIADTIINCSLNKYASQERLALKENNQNVPTCYRLNKHEYLSVERSRADLI